MAGAALLVAVSAPAQVAQKTKTAPSPRDRIDINHATTTQLLTAPGMTPSWAGRIIRFRPYRSKDELLTRGVVSGAVYNRIKDDVIAHQKPQ